MHDFGRATRRTCSCVRSLQGLILLLSLLSTTVFGQSQVVRLSLDDAVLNALQHNPRLQVFDVRMRGLQGLEQTATLRPAFELELEIENFSGNGELQGLDAAEQTVALSSILELGGKRSARMAQANARTRLAAAEREVEALKLLGEVTENFVAALAAQQRRDLAEDALLLARTTLQTVEQRAQAGAAPDAEVLRAKAALGQSKIAVTRLQHALETRKTKLATLWGATVVDFDELRGDLFQFPPADDFESLFARVKASPALDVFASETHLKDAELRLARARTAVDIGWSIGVRRVEETGDRGLVAGVSVPLFSGRRGRGEILAAEAEREQTELRREAALLDLHAQLFEAYQKRQQNVEAATALQNEIIPILDRALRETREAYERGRYSYLDLIAAQQELLDARQSVIDAAAAALAYGALIEMLTAEPLSAGEATR